MPGELRRVKDGVELLQYLRLEGAFEDRVSAPEPALILLDLNMPRKDGREALHEIRADSQLRSQPVVVLTTSRTAEDVVGSYRLGANSFISKPVGYRQLARVMEVLRSYWFDTAELPAPRSLKGAVSPVPRDECGDTAPGAVQLSLPDLVGRR